MTSRIGRLLAEIEAQRSAMPPAERAELERQEIKAQRESWVRAMGPCEHGVHDFEDCEQCQGGMSQ
jgi:hypothetical protein